MLIWSDFNRKQKKTCSQPHSDTLYTISNDFDSTIFYKQLLASEDFTDTWIVVILSKRLASTRSATVCSCNVINARFSLWEILWDLTSFPNKLVVCEHAELFKTNKLGIWLKRLSIGYKHCDSDPYTIVM